MKSVNKIGDLPVGRLVVADDLIEFHASRLLLLIHYCGTRDKIDGLTKLAKLDFFVRYPSFFDEVMSQENNDLRSSTNLVESSMVRHHYGPWDKRYYHILSFLEGSRQINVTKEGNTYYFELTEAGKNTAERLAKEEDFNQVIEQMKRVKKAFGRRAGSALKKLIYETFDREVGQKKLGEVIE